MIKILLVDDHVILREGICALLKKNPEIEISGEASDGKEAIEKVVALKPDLVLLDIAMPKLNGLETAKLIKEKAPETKIIILTQHDNKEYILSAIKTGVAGYVPKRALASELVSAIHAVQEGNSYLYPNVANVLIAEYRVHPDIDPYERLTQREKEILKLVISGLTSKSISESLKLSVKTVQGYQGKIKKKLGLKNRADLVKFAIRKGFVDMN